MKIFRTHTALLVWRITLLYVVLMLCRAVFYLYKCRLLSLFLYICLNKFI